MLCLSGLVKASLIILRKHEFDKTSRDAVDIHHQQHMLLYNTFGTIEVISCISPQWNTYMALGLNVIGAIPGGAPRHF